MKRLLSLILTIIMVFTLTASLIGCKKGGGSSGEYLSYNKSGATVFDYSKKDGTKTGYIKKFDQFATTWSFVGDSAGYVRETSLNQLSAIKEMNAESMRFDLFMGYTGVGYGIGNTAEKNGSTDEEYAQSLQVIKALENADVLPQLVLFACPVYAQSYGDWKCKPVQDKWTELCYNMATYFKNKDIRIGAYEMWNEPDFIYFSGTWEDYIDTYLWGAEGVRGADSDAFIQGMSASWIHKIVNEKENGQTLTKWESFIKRSSDANLLPDSISWHFYGREGRLEGIEGLSGDGVNFSVYRNAILNALTASQNGTSANDKTAYELATMQQHLNEFNTYVPLHADSADMWNTEQVVPGMFDAMEILLNANDITRVNWATFISEQTNGIGCSAIDLYSLQRYPAYHANWMYGRLPITRIEQPTLTDGLYTMAGVDEGRAGLIVYNTADKNKSTKVAFDNIPFEKGNVYVYVIDEDNKTFSTANPPVLVEWAENVEVNKLAANLKLKPNAAYYIEINNADGTQASYEVDSNLKENIVRKDYYYPNRGDNTPYTEIHENSMTAMVSMNNNATGKSAACVTLDDMIDNSQLVIDYTTYGDIQNTANASMGVKIDFMTEQGYVKSVYYNIGEMDRDMVLPFGTKASATEVKSLGAIGSGSCNINLTEIAPVGWTGRIIVSYLIQDAGTGATAQFKLSNR